MMNPWVQHRLLRRDAAFETSHGIAVRKGITNNGVAYRAHAWKRALTADGVSVRFRCPFHRQTIGKIERFHRTLRDERAYGKDAEAQTPASKLWPTGYTSTTSPDHTPHSEANHA